MLVKGESPINRTALPALVVFGCDPDESLQYAPQNVYLVIFQNKCSKGEKRG